MSYEEQHAILCEAELAAEQADAREAARIVRVAGPRQCATGLRVVSR